MRDPPTQRPEFEWQCLVSHVPCTLAATLACRQRFLWGGMRNTVEWGLLVVSDAERGRQQAAWRRRRRWWAQAAASIVAVLSLAWWLGLRLGASS